ncbi:hypothetical protein BH160DRAFT_7169 [Burkholderia sp. H160]|nr:hypothetical protein BH160DRAFT_7169 [Burkholderia sp. H160]
MTTSIEKITPYDEFNYAIPEDEFLKYRMSARCDRVPPANCLPC